MNQEVQGFSGWARHQLTGILLSKPNRSATSRTLACLFTLLLIAAAPLIQAAQSAAPSADRILQDAGVPISALAFSLDGQLLASGSEDGKVTLWNVTSGELLRTALAHTGKVAAVAFSPDRKLFASGGQDRSVRIWTVQGQELRKIDGHTNGVSALAFSPDGKTFVSGGTDGAVLLWNTRDWTLKHRLVGHPSCVHALRVSSNGEFLASGSDECLRIWDLQNPERSFDTLHDRVRAISYFDLNVRSPGDAKPKFASSDGKGLQLWQPAGIIGTHILAPWRDHIGVIYSQSKNDPSAVAAEDGLTAAGWTNGAVDIWNANGYGSVTLQAHEAPVKSMTFSTHGAHLATAGSDGTLKLWGARKRMDQAELEASRQRELNKQRK